MKVLVFPALLAIAIVVGPPQTTVSKAPGKQAVLAAVQEPAVASRQLGSAAAVGNSAEVAPKTHFPQAAANPLPSGRASTARR